MAPAAESASFDVVLEVNNETNAGGPRFWISRSTFRGCARAKRIDVLFEKTADCRPEDKPEAHCPKRRTMHPKPERPCHGNPDNVGALIIRIGFWGILYYDFNKAILMIKEPSLLRPRPAHWQVR